MTVARPTVPAPSFPTLPMVPRLLLGPGPNMVHPRVTAAMTAPLLGHLDPDFIEVMDRTQELLRYVFGTQNTLTFTISGTGSASMEACVAGVIEPGDTVLACVGGYFGQRIAEMARRHGGEVETIERRWGEVFPPEQVEEALRRRPARIVAIVHAETSTGVLQPLGEIARIVHAEDGLLLADTVTSLGGAPVQIDQVGIDISYSATQKCIGAPPGLGPVTVGPRAEAKIAARRTPIDSWYLDLPAIARYWGPEHVYHHTAPIALHFALYEALVMVVEEGLKARWTRHRRNAELLWSGLEELGLTLHVDQQDRLPSLTTVRIPEGADDVDVRRRLLTEYGIEIGGGLGELKGKVWRIGLMAHSSRPENVVLVLAALRKLLGR